MSNGTAVAYDIDADLADLQEELDNAKNFTRWMPPAGNYDCLFDKLVVIFQESNGVNFPVYKPFFKILDEPHLDGDTFSRWFGLKPTKGRPFQMTELVALARACNGGEEVDNIKDAIATITAASDAGDTLVNVTVSHRTYAVNEDGTPKVAADFTYASAAPAPVTA